MSCPARSNTERVPSLSRAVRAFAHMHHWPNKTQKTRAAESREEDTTLQAFCRDAREIRPQPKNPKHTNVTALCSPDETIRGTPCRSDRLKRQPLPCARPCPMYRVLCCAPNGLAALIHQAKGPFVPLDISRSPRKKKKAACGRSVTAASS